MGVKELVELLAAPFGLGAGAVIAVYLAQWVLSRLAAGGDGYTRKKGENLATKEDLADAVKQLKEFESARTEVAHNDWIAREWKGVRARNLEPFLAALHESYDYIQAVVLFYFHGVGERVPNDFRAPRVRVLTLQQLYYPELSEQISKYLDRCDDLRVLAINYWYTQQSPDVLRSAERAEHYLARFDVTDAELDVALEATSQAIAAVGMRVFNAVPDKAMKPAP